MILERKNVEFGFHAHVLNRGSAGVRRPWTRSEVNTEGPMPIRMKQRDKNMVQRNSVISYPVD